MNELIHSDDFVTATQKPPGVQLSLINPIKDSVIAGMYFTYHDGKIHAYIISKESISVLRDSKTNVMQHTRLMRDDDVLRSTMHEQQRNRLENRQMRFSISNIDEFENGKPEKFYESLGALCDAGHFSTEYSNAVKHAVGRITQAHIAPHQAKLDYENIANIIRESVREPS